MDGAASCILRNQELFSRADEQLEGKRQSVLRDTAGKAWSRHDCHGNVNLFRLDTISNTQKAQAMLLAPFFRSGLFTWANIPKRSSLGTRNDMVEIPDLVIFVVLTGI